MSDVSECLELNQKLIKELSVTLSGNGFKTLVLSNEETVIDFIHQIPNDVIIGLGDSITTCSLKIRNILANKGSLIYYGWNGDRNYNRSLETFEGHPMPEYFLTRINALTLSGDMLIKDYSKQALQEKRFPKRILAFAGCNRIVREFDDTPGIQKYSIFKSKPEHVDFTVVLLPTMTY